MIRRQPRAVATRCPPRDARQSKEIRKRLPQTKENKLTAYSSPPNRASSTAICARCSSHSRFSHSVASHRFLFCRCQRWACRLANARCCEKSRIAWLHRSSAKSSATLARSLPHTWPECFLVSSRTVAQKVFCWAFHCG